MYILGIDLGGTNIAIGLCNENLEIIDKDSVPTRAEREGEGGDKRRRNHTFKHFRSPREYLLPQQLRFRLLLPQLLLPRLLLQP